MNIDIKEYAQLAAGVYATTPNNVLENPSGWTPDQLIKDQSDGFSAGVFEKRQRHRHCLHRHQCRQTH